MNNARSGAATRHRRRRSWPGFLRGGVVALALVCALALGSLLVTGAHAQEPGATATPPAAVETPTPATPQPSATPDLPITAGVTATPGAGATPGEGTTSGATPAQPSRLATISSLGFGDVRVTGARVSKEFFFLGSGDFPLGNNSRVILVLSHSNLLRAEDSTVTVTLNDRALHTIRLDSSNVNETRYEVPIPRDVIDRGFNRLSFQFAMAIDQSACADPNHPALYATLLSGTGLLIDYATEPPVPKLDPPDLSAYPYPFFKGGYPVVAPVDIVVPDTPNGVELTSAYRLAANLAARVFFDLNLLQIRRVSDLTDTERATHQLIVIGTPDRNPLTAPVLAGSSVQFTSAGLVRAGQLVASDVGVLVVQPSPWNATFRALAITGGTDAAIARDVDALTSSQPTALLAGPASLLTEPVQKPPSGVLTQIFTFAQTGAGEQTFSGGTSTEDVGFSAPAPAPGSSGELDLIVSTPETLDRSRSNVVVQLNGQDVDTIVLDQTQTRRASYKVTLPADAFRVGPNTLRLVASIYAPAVAVLGPCISSAPERAWVTFHSDSAIKLPATAATGEGVTLASLPYPFAGLEGMRSTVVVVDPAHPASLRDGMLVTIALGRRFGASNEFTVMPAAAANQATIGDNNIVAVALPADSAIDQELAKVLPLVLRPDGTRALVQEQGGVLTQILASTRLGAVQEAQVPWAPTRRVLAINGTDDTALGWAATALTNQGLDGNVALFQAADQVNTFSLQRISDAQLQKQLQERFKPEEARGRTIISFLLIGGGAGVLLGLWGLRGRLRPGLRR
jgi:hypothetical protein